MTRGMTKDLDPVRALPDFAVIGFAKCGTTSIFDWLATHPSVATASSDKEPGLLLDRPADQLAAAYATELGNPASGLVGDGTPGYLGVDDAARCADLLVGLNPGCRLVVTYRDPLERALSAFRFRVSNGTERDAEPGAWRSALSLDSRYVQNSRYGSAIRPYLRVFPPDSILVGDIRAFTSDTGWAALTGHMGLEPIELQRAHRNPTGVVHAHVQRTRRLHHLTGVKALRNLLPGTLTAPLRRVLTGAPVPLPSIAEMRDALDHKVVNLLDRELEDFHRLTAGCVAIDPR